VRYEFFAKNLESFLVALSKKKAKAFFDVKTTAFVTAQIIQFAPFPGFNKIISQL